jgi:hypothetical protein
MRRKRDKENKIVQNQTIEGNRPRNPMKQKLDDNDKKHSEIVQNQTFEDNRPRNPIIKAFEYMTAKNPTDVARVPDVARGLDDPDDSDEPDYESTPIK